jgi:SAM-dependent methyltransferase
MRLEQPLFNRTIWHTKRQRLNRQSFLLRLVREEARQRLSLIEHTFERALLIGAYPDKPLAPSDKVKQWVYTDGAHAPLAQCKAPAFICTDEALPVKPDSFDCIAHILTLHHANQIPLVLKNMHDALKPDGLLLACLFAPDTLYELKTCLLEAELKIKNGAAQRFIPLADIRTLGNLLQAARYALPVADISSVTIRYQSLQQLFNDIRQSAETQNFMRSSPLRRDVLKQAEALYHEKFSDPDGKIRATFHFAWLIGWKPHPSQPKPSKRGSGQVSLAQAVKGKPQ